MTRDKISRVTQNFAVTAGSWQRLSISGTAPAGTVTVSPRIGRTATYGTEPYYIDGVMVEATASADSYFDGSSTGAAWNGTAHLSSSTLTLSHVESDNHSVYTFSNDHTVEGHICISAFANSLDTDEVINHITFRNLEAVEDELTTVDHIYKDDASALYYGVRKQAINTTLDPASLDGYAEHVFGSYSEARSRVRQIAFPMDHFERAGYQDAVFIDIGDVVEVVMNDPTNTALDNITSVQRVAEISHRITPDLWDTQITLL